MNELIWFLNRFINECVSKSRQSLLIPVQFGKMPVWPLGHGIVEPVVNKSVSDHKLLFPPNDF